MGEVCKARDTRLERTVAIKVLPEHVASDPALKQRFEREAKTISSLNHPHICTLYDIGSQDGIDFLVMEYLDGETLAQRLTKGALPLEQALTVAIEIADALDKAHRQGITHRDLKPGNIMLAKTGAKLLDFGLAKLKPAEAAGGLTAMPTQEAPLTEQGAILGTFQYTAPEQLEGQEADHRTDIFAFGAVVYEMSTGKKAFEGKTQASLITAIMASEPSPISTVQSLSPPLLDEIIKTCLAKDADERWQSAGDLGRQLKIVQGGSQPSIAVPAVTRPRRACWRPATPSVIAGLVIRSLITGLAVWSVTRPAPRPVARAMVTPPVSQPVILGAPDVNVALTPDGTRLVYRATIDALPYFSVRPLAELEATPLRGLTARPRNPFISSDGNWVGFFDAPGTLLYRVSILGGPPLTICTLPSGGPAGASWGADDTIIFATHAGDSGLWRVPAGGGEPELLTTPNADEGERDHLWPDILPGGEAVLFTITTTGPIENSQIAVLTLENRETKLLIPGGSNPRYVPTGHIVYGVQGTLRAVTFDLDTLTVTSDPIPVVDGVNTSRTGSADFAVALDGSLVYATASGVGANDFALVWVDRGGREEAVGAEPGPYAAPQLSPDGTRVALVRVDEGGGTDIHIYDLARNNFTQLTFSAEVERVPLWTPDGERIVFTSNRDGALNLYVKNADGTGDIERLTESDDDQVASSWSVDGQTLVLRSGADLHTLSVGGEQNSSPLLESGFLLFRPMVSPDGRWVAYESNEDGDFDIYVRPFPNVDGGRWKVSTNGGSFAAWSPDGQELFFSSGNAVMVVSVTTTEVAFILAEATLSYVGLGFAPPAASWGVMLQEASNIRAIADIPWLLSPAAAIIAVVLGVNLVTGAGSVGGSLGLVSALERRSSSHQL